MKLQHLSKEELDHVSLECRAPAAKMDEEIAEKKGKPDPIVASQAMVDDGAAQFGVCFAK